MATDAETHTDPGTGPGHQPRAHNTNRHASRRIPVEEHTSRPWRIHEIAPDFLVEDVWALPTPGGPDDFPRLIFKVMGSGRPEAGQSAVGRLVWAVRWKLGEWFHWDTEDMGLDARVPSLRDRLPDDLRDGPTGPELTDAPFTPLFLTRNEWAAEIANRTVHGVMHIGWVPDDGERSDDHGTGTGRGSEPRRYHAQMAVLVKPNGLLGRLYLAGIKPFRLLLIYPALLREIERQWSESA